MNPDSLDFILRPVSDEQAEYAEAAAHKNSPAADVEGAPASGAPRWAPVDDERGDLLDLLANEHPAIPSEADEWETFTRVLAIVARETSGVIDQNLTRPRLHGVVSPQRVGPMFRRACREGLIRPNGWTTTDNSESGNVGRPARSYDWLGIRLGT